MDVLKYAEKYLEIKDKSEQILNNLIEHINIKGQINQEDIKQFYFYFTSLSNIINEIKPNYFIFNDHLKEQRIKLVERCEEEKKMFIQYIIYLSYASFMDNIKLKKDCKPLLLDIQKSPFYLENKNHEKIKEMEKISKIYDIINDVKNNKNYRNAYKEFIDLEKKIFDEDLKDKIEQNIQICKKGIIDKERKDLEKLMSQKDFEDAIKKTEQILNEFKDDDDLWEDILDIKIDYLYILEKSIEKKIK